MNYRKFHIIAICLTLFVAKSLFSQIIYLKDGGMVDGAIVKEDENYIFVETKDEWKKIKRDEIDNSKAGKFNKAQMQENELAEHLSFGPKLGIFYPTDSILSSCHKTNFQWGIFASFWKQRKGLLIEFENYKDSYIQYGIKDDLSLFNIWLSLLYRGKSTPYFYVGGGLGLSTVKIHSNTSLLNLNYPGYQLLVGLRNKQWGLSFKYSLVDTIGEWNPSINFGGVSLSLDIVL